MKPHGFTLVELIVAIGIMAMITTLAIVNLRGQQPTELVRDQARNVASLLRQAQVQAISGQPTDGVVPIGGYGVVVASCATPPCSVQLFADKNGNFALDSGELQQTVSLGQSVTIQTVTPQDPINILFKPPSAFVCFNNSCSGSDTAVITLGVKTAANTSTISVQQLSGQISSS